MSSLSSLSIGSREDCRTPELSQLTASDGLRYLEAAKLVALARFPNLVPIIEGALPLSMIEYVQAFDRPNVIASMAGLHLKEDGTPSTDHKLASTWRKEIISKVIAERSTGSKPISEAMAIDIIFPPSGSKDRRESRKHLELNITDFIQKLTQFWPRPNVAEQLRKNQDLTDALKSMDLIRWIAKFQELCLTGSGNNNENRARAEATVRDLKQTKGEDSFLEYIKDYRSGLLNLRNCKSSLSDVELVTYFIKGLDQTKNGHHNWYMQYLDEYTLLHATLKDKNIESVILLAEKHFNSVTRLVRQSSNTKRNNNNTSTTDIALTVEAVNNNNKRPFGATKNNNNKNPNINPNIKKQKTTAELNSRFSVDQLAKFKLIPCKNFVENGSCTYGDECRFLHKKESKKTNPKKA